MTHSIALFVTLALLTNAIPNEAITALVMAEAPITTIEGPLSGITHPEGIAFSPAGDFIAVVNAKGNNITFYNHTGNSEASFETEPAFTIQGPRSKLLYPHDISFTPDGAYIAVASARNMLVAIFKKSEKHQFYDAVPCAIIKNQQWKLKQAQAVKYSPVENILAVANVLEHTIALYRYQDENYEAKPYQIIESSREILCNPDGLAFSSDGELLAVTSHVRHAVLIYQRIPDSGGLFSPEPVEILQGPETNLCFPHSLYFHPSNDYLVVSCAGGRKTLNVFKKISDNFPRYATLPVQTLEIFNPETIALQDQYPEEGGVKGLAFSRDGCLLGICSSDIAHDDRKVLIYSFVSQ